MSQSSYSLRQDCCCSFPSRYFKFDSVGYLCPEFLASFANELDGVRQKQPHCSSMRCMKNSAQRMAGSMGHRGQRIDEANSCDTACIMHSFPGFHVIPIFNRSRKISEDILYSFNT